MKLPQTLIITILLGLRVTFVQAAVTAVQRSAVLKITRPQGEVLTVTPQEDLPGDLQGAVLEAVEQPEKTVSADLKIRGQNVHLTPGKRIRIEETSGDGFIVLNGKVVVTAPSGTVRIIGERKNLEAKGAAMAPAPPAIRGPEAVEREIQAEEDLPDISPIHS